MLGVPAAVLFSYNGYSFNATVRTKVTEEPIQSGDGRVIKYSKITIHTSGYLTQDDINAAVGAVQGGTLDELMGTIRRKLQVNGKNLKYVNKGYGVDIDINNPAPGPNSQRDVAMGPKAGKFSWFSLGGAPDGCHGAAFEWEVSTCIPECEDFPIEPGAGVFVEISYTANYDVGEDGLVIITTAGTLQIPLSLRADNTLNRTIDESLDTGVIRPKPVGFMRRHSRQISADRASCTFTITDRQLEVSYPNDVVTIDMKHRVRQAINGASPKWNCSISGTVRLSPTADKFLAARRFFAIAAKRMLFARNNASVIGIRPGIIVMSTEIEEDLFKNEAHFSVSYIMNGVPIEHLINVSGLWRVVSPAVGAPDTLPGDQFDRDTSHESLIDNAQRFKGIRVMSFDRTGDVILDVCAGPPPSPAVPPEDQGHGINIEPGAVSAENDDLEEVPVDVPDESVAVEGSWIDWHCEKQLIVNHHFVQHTPMKGTVTYNAQSVQNPFGGVAGVTAEDRPPEMNWGTDNVSLIQQIQAPSIRLRLVGFAVRIGYRVRPPIGVSYGGRDLYLASETVSESTLAMSGTTIMYRTDWDLTYIVLSPPDALPLPANPFLQIDGDTPTA